MISIYVILYIIFVHWVADFILQDEKWALGKSKNLRDLLSHTSLYGIVWIFAAIPLFSVGYGAVLYGGITFIFHTLTDYFTSKLVSKKFFYKDLGGPIPNLGAFTYIGGDQVLHYIQLFLTYLLIISL